MIFFTSTKCVAFEYDAVDDVNNSDKRAVEFESGCRWISPMRVVRCAAALQLVFVMRRRIACVHGLGTSMLPSPSAQGRGRRESLFWERGEIRISRVDGRRCAFVGMFHQLFKY